MSKSPTKIHCRVVVQKSLPAFLFKLPIDLPCFCEISKKNPFESFPIFEASNQFAISENSKGLMFHRFTGPLTPFWNFDPLTFSPWEKPCGKPGGALFGDAGDGVKQKHHRVAFWGFHNKTKNEFGPTKIKLAKVYPSFFYPFLVEEISQRKKANIHEFQRLFPWMFF